jgi:hypothetical protein
MVLGSAAAAERDGMSGNAASLGRVYWQWLINLSGADAHCDVCSGHLPDHDWADFDELGNVVECSHRADGR